MALLFMDGFSHYATADFNKKYSRVEGSPTISSSNGRFFGDAMEANGADYLIFNAGTTFQEWIYGFGWYMQSEGGDGNFVQLYNESDNQEYVRFATNVSENEIDFIIDGTTIASATYVVQNWHYIEVRIKIDQVSGSYTFNFDGTTIASATGVDTQPDTFVQYPDTIRFGRITGGSTLRFDDFYVCDTTGSVNNDIIGEPTIETIRPTVDGATQNFTASSAGDNFADIDDATPDGDSTYVHGNTAGNKDTYTMGDLSSTSGTVLGVQTVLTAKKNNVALRKLEDVVRHSGTDANGVGDDPFVLALGYNSHVQLHDVNPVTSTSWTISDINNAEFGFRIET